jgi:hypothetical protein
MLLALFAVTPITCSCLVSLFYSMYLFMAYEESGVHHAQEFENRFWTIFALLLSTALFFARDSPLAFGLWSPSLGFVTVIMSGYAMHLWDRYLHRLAMSQQTFALRRNQSTSSSLLRLKDLGIPVEAQLEKINACLRDIDQLLIPSTINNFINQRFTLSKEREIITIFEECDARALNYLINHVQLGLLFYKIKDHRNFNGKHRSEFINLLAVERLSILTVISRVIVLHSLQLLKLRANPRAEYWVRNIILNTHQDELSELKTLTDAKGDYFCMNKLIFDDIRSETVRQDILNHIRREAAVQETHMEMGTRRSKQRLHMQWRKVLSDVDDTLCCSGGSYPSGVDKRYTKKTVYPGVLAFYRELDLGTQGPEEWQDDRVGNLVFLSARPHVYKDVSERANFAKFQQLRVRGDDGRQGMHTVPSLLAGDLTSGSHYVVTNDFEPLARKKFDNFRRYASIYPEYQHIFVCDNGQGDVRAGEMMFDAFPYSFGGLYVHVVQGIPTTYGYDPARWREKEFAPCFFRSYPEAALHAAKRKPPLIRLQGLQRICHDAVKDFAQIKTWPSDLAKAERRRELNQAVWRANDFLEKNGLMPAELIPVGRRWADGQKVRTPYGIARIRGFNPIYDMYDVELDWRPLDVQAADHEEVKDEAIRPRPALPTNRNAALSTVEEIDEVEDTPAHIDSEVPELAEEATQDLKQEVGEPSSERREQRASPSLSRTSSMPVTLSPRRDVPLVKSKSVVTSVHAESLQKKASLCETRTYPFAQVSGLCITKYTPPVLPKLGNQRRGSFLKFLGPTVETAKQPTFKEGDQCITPYGPAKVVELREKQGKHCIVVVKMVGWPATGYLQLESLKPMPKSLLGKLLRQFGTTEGAQKPLEFPHAEGTLIETPFGRCSVMKPLPPPTNPTKHRPSVGRTPATLGLSIGSWTLADGTHPMLYCTVESARSWKDHKAGDGTSILSTLGTLLISSRTLLEPFLSPKAIQSKTPEFPRYYQDSAAVTTPYGDGAVVCFRVEDGFYEVALTGWTLANGKHARTFLRREDISYRRAKGCEEGYPVLTSLGLSGTLASVEPTTGVHIVTIPSAGMVCYLQPECVIRPLKAAVGEDVSTPVGEGRVQRYDAAHDMYTIVLNGWNAKLYAKGDTFDRVSDGIQDRDGAFGVNWLLRFFFSPAGAGVASNVAPRSRSNSITSIMSGGKSSRASGV